MVEHFCHKCHAIVASKPSTSELLDINLRRCFARLLVCVLLLFRLVVSVLCVMLLAAGGLHMSST
jgi:hypothetical protein